MIATNTSELIKILQDIEREHGSLDFEINLDLSVRAYKIDFFSFIKRIHIDKTFQRSKDDKQTA